jgi:peptide/nickel transport system substrate-binding protein
MKHSPATRLTLTAAAVALAAAACLGGSGAPGSGLAPTAGGTLSVAIGSGPTYADPSLDSDAGSLLVANQVVEGLVGIRSGTTSEVVPVLAASLPTVSGDGLTWTVKLRSGVRFHDGTALDATAVKANYDRWRAFPKELSGQAKYYAAAFGGFGDASNIVSVEASDQATVVFHLKAPQSNFLISQANPAFGIQSPAAISANDGDNANLAANAYANGTGGKGRAMVGTGPFILSEWKQGDHATLVRNVDYWDVNSRAYLDEIDFRTIADPTERTTALRNGKVDLVETLDPAAVSSLGSNSGVRVLSRATSCGVVQLDMNHGGGFGKLNVLSSTPVRFAVAAAVRKDQYAAAHYAGGAVAADNWLPAGAQYYRREYLPGYDLSVVRSYFARSGLAASAMALDLVYPSGTSTALLPNPEGLAKSIAADLETAGFKVTLRSEAPAAYAADAAAGKLQMWLGGATCTWAGPDVWLDVFHYVNGTAHTTLNYANDDLDAAITTAMTALTDDSAKMAWQSAQDLVRVDMPTVPLLDVLPQAGARTNVLGFVGSGLGLEKFATVWLGR